MIHCSCTELHELCCEFCEFCSAINLLVGVKWLIEYSFTLFHHAFWKRTTFKGVPVLGFLGFLFPKVHRGFRNIWKKFQKFSETFDDLARL